MNLKNKYLSNKLLKWADKRCKTFNIYIVVFLSCIKLFLSYNIIFLSFLHLCITSVNHIIHGSWYRERDRQNFLSFWAIFCPFLPLTTQKMKIMKKRKKKNTWRNDHFTLVHHKWQSYDVWFLGYGARQTKYFVILGHFLPFNP